MIDTVKDILTHCKAYIEAGQWDELYQAANNVDPGSIPYLSETLMQAGITLWDAPGSKIPNYAYAAIENLPSTVTIRNMDIGYHAFANSDGIETLTLSDCSVDRDAFSDCSIRQLKGTGQLSLSRWAFEGNYSLQFIDLEQASLTRVPENCFENCRRLTSVILPHDCTYIEAEAFGSCDNLTDITIPNTLKDASILAFDNCWLKRVYYSDTLEELVTHKHLAKALLSGMSAEGAVICSDGTCTRDQLRDLYDRQYR